MFSGVKLSIRLFVLFYLDGLHEICDYTNLHIRSSLGEILRLSRFTMALRFSESDLNVVLSNEGRDYNEHFQTYKFYFSMRMRFSQQGDDIIFVGDLLNLHGDALDRIFEQVFRACARSVNLQHFHGNSISQKDFVQFTLEHTNFVDYVKKRQVF